MRLVLLAATFHTTAAALALPSVLTTRGHNATAYVVAAAPGGCGARGRRSSYVKTKAGMRGFCFVQAKMLLALVNARRVAEARARITACRVDGVLRDSWSTIGGASNL